MNLRTGRFGSVLLNTEISDIIFKGKFRIMDKNKEAAVEAIEKKKDIIYGLADEIWSHPELSLREYNSCGVFCELLEKEGFEVKRGISGIETAFEAKFGDGRPVIAILAEYDALSGLSQKAFCAERRPRDVGDLSSDCGHGCGHNLLGAGALAGALGIKAYLENSGRPGTVILYGCPGEEGVASKAFFARDGVWDNVDAALTWHPETCNEVAVGSSNACIQTLYEFHGMAAHASAHPEAGRSALDAVELMNVGVQFLREHMSDKARIHYAVTNTGGMSPNVVQAEASVLYMVRCDKVSEALKLQERVDKIAQGAALMTETTFTRSFVDGLSELVPNHVLEGLFYKCFSELGVPHYTEEEKKFAEELSKTYDTANEIPGLASPFSADYAENVEVLRNGRRLNDFLLPLYDKETFEPGSTDVGDVSWCTPTAQVHVAAWPNGCPAHSWQSTASAGSSIGRKAAVHAGKIIACAAVELFQDEELLKEARREFEKRTRAGYTCPIPEDAVAKAVV